MTENAFEVFLGKEGLNKTFQDEFPETTECCYCGKTSRIGFVASEKGPQANSLCEIHNNDPEGEGYWLHDSCAVAVYFCTGCLEPTALYNQA